jgi:hypothetical protein
MNPVPEPSSEASTLFPPKALPTYLSANSISALKLDVHLSAVKIILQISLISLILSES